MRTLIRITAPHFVAGLVVSKHPDGVWRAFDAAPILFYMVKQRWTLDQVENYLTRKKWTWEVLTNGYLYGTV
jgi:hypothetical protein